MSQIIVNYLENMLGKHVRHDADKGQISFDCPACAADKGIFSGGDGKGNLEVNYKENKFKCWACWGDNDMSGKLTKLIRRYGNKETLEAYIKELEYYSFKNVLDYGDEVKLLKKLVKPTNVESFNFNHLNISSTENEALKYLKKRRIDSEIINKYKIGYIGYGEMLNPNNKNGETFKLKNRIYLPSYDSNGFLNYFTTRDFSGKAKKMKYINPEVNKEEIIFNERLINWDGDVYLVEGPFDHIVIPNSIPMLGKNLYDLLYLTIQNKANANVIVFTDGDAWENGIQIFRKLNTGKLEGRVKIIKVRKDLDPSIINEKYGKKGILQVLRSAYKLKEEQYFFI